MNGRQNQRPFVGIDRQHAADAVVGRLERHVAEQTFEAAIAFGHALKMFQVAQTFGMVVGIVLLEDRHVILHQILRLLGRQLGLGGFFEHLGERSQPLGDFAFGLVGAQPLDGSCRRRAAI